jgi:ATP-dependent DNA ligase
MNSRPWLGALLLGYYDPDGRLVYGGRAGTGIDHAELERGGTESSSGESDANSVSAPGARSLAATVSPRARNTAVQLAPIVPVPIAATRRMLNQ